MRVDCLVVVKHQALELESRKDEREPKFQQSHAAPMLVETFSLPWMLNPGSRAGKLSRFLNGLLKFAAFSAVLPLL